MNFRRRSLRIAAGCAVVLLALPAFAGSWTVVSRAGDAAMRPADEDAWVEVRLGQALPSPLSIRTGADGRLTLLRGRDAVPQESFRRLAEELLVRGQVELHSWCGSLPTRLPGTESSGLPLGRSPRW